MGKKKLIILISSIASFVVLAVAITLILVFTLGGNKTTETPTEKYIDSARSIKIVQMEGTGTVTDDTETVNCFKGMNLYDGDVLNVGTESIIVVKFDDDKYVYFGEETKVNIKSEGTDKFKTNIFVENGIVLAEIQNKLGVDEEFFLSTNNSVMAVRGTIFGVEVKDKGNEFIETYSVYKGVTELFVFDKLVDSIIKGKLSDISNKKIEIKVPKDHVIEKKAFDDLLDDWLSDINNKFDDPTDANDKLDEVEITVDVPTEEDYEKVIGILEDLKPEDKTPSKEDEKIEYSSIVYTSNGYFGNYDGEGHSISVTPDNKDAKVFYKGEGEVEYKDTNDYEYTDVGTYRVYYKIECEGFETKEDFEVIQISKGNLSSSEKTIFETDNLLITGVTLDVALDGLSLSDYFEITGAEKDIQELQKATFAKSSDKLKAGTNTYKVKVELPDSIKDNYNDLYVDLEITINNLEIYDSNAISNGYLYYNYVNNQAYFDRFNGILEDYLFGNLTLKAGNISISSNDYNDITFIYDKLVDGYYEINDGINTVGVKIEFDDFIVETEASFNVSDDRADFLFDLKPNQEYVDSLGGDKYHFKNVENLPVDGDYYVLSGNDLLTAFNIESESLILINFDKNAISEAEDINNYTANATLKFKKDDMSTIELLAYPSRTQKSSSITLDVYFSTNAPTDFPTYSVSDNLTFKYDSNGTVINNIVESTASVKYSLDDITYSDSVTVNEVGTYVIYFKVGEENQRFDSVEIKVEKAKITSDYLGFIMDEVSILSNDNGHQIYYTRAEGEGTTTELLKSNDGSIISPFEDVYTVYTNMLLNGNYYDSISKESIDAEVSVSSKVANSADFTYSIKCDGYDEISGSVTFKYTEIGYTGSVISASNPSDLVVSKNDLSSVYANEPEFGISSASTDVGQVIYYSIDDGKTWTTEVPQLIGVGEYNVYSILAFYYNEQPFNPSGKEPSYNSLEISMDGNFMISIQNIVITE